MSTAVDSLLSAINEAYAKLLDDVYANIYTERGMVRKQGMDPYGCVVRRPYLEETLDADWSVTSTGEAQLKLTAKYQLLDPAEWEVAVQTWGNDPQYTLIIFEKQEAIQ